MSESGLVILILVITFALIFTSSVHVFAIWIEEELESRRREMQTLQTIQQQDREIQALLDSIISSNSENTDFITLPEYGTPKPFEGDREEISLDSLKESIMLEEAITQIRFTAEGGIEENQNSHLVCGVCGCQNRDLSWLMVEYQWMTLCGICEQNEVNKYVDVAT